MANRDPVAAPVTRLLWSMDPVRDMEALLPGGRTALVAVDARARRADAPGLKGFWRKLERGAAGGPVSLRGGEAVKSWKMVERLHASAAAAGVRRDGRFVAVGGGAVLDLAGFAAGTWLRGVETAYVPTTLLAMVDASVGGKTAINTREGKNLVGLFHPPSLVLFSPVFLAGLDRRQVLCGWAEMVKHALLMSREAFREAAAVSDPAAWLQSAPGDALDMVRRNVAFKDAVVRRDPQERSGVRALLNLGHTVAHGLEVASSFRVPHGMAVGAGLRVEARLAALLGILPREEERWIQSVLAGWGFGRTLGSLAPEKLVPHFLKDKKSRDDRIPFVFLERVGRVHSGADGAVTHLTRSETRRLLGAAFREGF